MLKGLLTGVFLVLGLCLVYLAYGKKGIAAKKALGEKLILPTVIIMFVSGLYALLIGLWNMEAENDWYEYAFLIGAPVCYLLYVLYARNWAKRACALLEQQQQAELQAKKIKEVEQQQKLQKEKEREIAKKQNEELLAQAFFENSGTMTIFAQRVNQCDNFKDVLSLWDSLHVVDNETTNHIRNEILKNVKAERAYGSSSLDIANFSKHLLDVYAAAKIELEAEAETEKETVCLSDSNIVQTFVENAQQSNNFVELLSMWKSLTLEDKTAYEEIRNQLNSAAKTERVYGSSPKERADFLEKLLQDYGPKE